MAKTALSKHIFKRIAPSLQPRSPDTLDKLPSPLPRQKLLLDSQADICIFGGAAGGGKTLGLLLDFGRKDFLANSDYSSVIFRRTYPMVRNEGGLWDESSKIYPTIEGHPNMSDLKWYFPTGASIRFAHLQHEKNIYDWQGAQLTRIGFDELTHFTFRQFLYLLSRARSLSGIKPQIRATCNPDADSWVAKIVSWWIGDDGFPIPSRSGKLRYFVMRGDTINDLIWADTPEELIAQFPESRPKSLTFIPSKITDNPILLNKDPDYLANLQAQNRIERARLLDGNWKISAANGIIDPSWVQRYRVPPANFKRIVQSWDTANKKGETSAYWSGTTWGEFEGNFYLLDAYTYQHNYPDGKRAVISQAQKWNPNEILIEDKASGIILLQEMKQETNYRLLPINPEGDKVTRFATESTAYEARRIYHPETAPWLGDYETVLFNFPYSTIADPVDSTSQFLRWTRSRNIVLPDFGTL